MNDWFNCSHGHPAGVWRLALQSEQSIWRHVTASANRGEADHHANGLCWTNGWCSQVYSCRSNVYRSPRDLMKCVCWCSWTVSTALCVVNTATVIGSGSSTSPQRNTSTECWAEREKMRVCPGPIASLDPVSPSVPGTQSSSQWTWSMMSLLKNSSDWSEQTSSPHLLLVCNSVTCCLISQGVVYVLIGCGVWLTGWLMVVLKAWVVTSLTVRRSFRSGTDEGIFCAGGWTKPELTCWSLQLTMTLGSTTSCFRTKQTSTHLYWVCESYCEMSVCMF